jgi:DeoR/GlpR family transcriptional regulator of sugar metabolism
MIPKNLKATFFTVSPQAAITLSEHSNLEVITIGGKLSKNANLHTGTSVINELSDLKVDLCLLGANAFSVEEGLTDMDWEIVQVNKAIVNASRKVAVLAIAEKLNTSQRIRICPINKINYLITELPPESPYLANFRNDDLKLL